VEHCQTNLLFFVIILYWTIFETRFDYLKNCWLSSQLKVPENIMAWQQGLTAVHDLLRNAHWVNSKPADLLLLMLLPAEP